MAGFAAGFNRTQKLGHGAVETVGKPLAAEFGNGITVPGR
jgi:hypothetical protein